MEFTIWIHHPYIDRGFISNFRLSLKLKFRLSLKILAIACEEKSLDKMRVSYKFTVDPVGIVNPRIYYI
jgi:hypothetical protein